MSFQIETGRLIIRDVREEDIPILVKQNAEPEARGGILSFQADETYNKKELEKAMAWAQYQRRPYYKLSVALKTDGTLIGSCTYTDVVPESYEAAIGWHYGHRFRGNGYATEAAYAMIDFAFGFVGVNEIFADCFAENRASIRIMEKTGMSSGWNFDLFNVIRGWSYGEQKAAVRYVISKRQWSAKHFKSRAE
ncbi:MAG: GNAT family N-acetyltransferase [Pyrinomonadaceae bacterium]|nr:GNAT family N-acetyltransferase [Pyrinomonadaceae bacterium]